MTVQLIAQRTLMTVSFAMGEIHWVAWVLPGGVAKSQMDHIGIGGKFRRSLHGVRVRGGVGMGM